MFCQKVRFLLKVIWEIFKLQNKSETRNRLSDIYIDDFARNLLRSNFSELYCHNLFHIQSPVVVLK